MAFEQTLGSRFDHALAQLILHRDRLVYLFAFMLFMCIIHSATMCTSGFFGSECIHTQFEASYHAFCGCICLPFLTHMCVVPGLHVDNVKLIM